MLLSELHCLVPLVEQNTAVNSLLHITSLHETLHCQFGNTQGNKFLSKFFEDWGVLRENLDKFL